ncbi:MAG: hypothetical protein J6K98_00715, partial [Clostridia bacterium]|nr:hypothetical protein [Clostridia bacterium]
MIRSVSLWHVTPVDLGVEFFDPTSTTLEANESLYRLVNDPNCMVQKAAYSKQDYKALLNMRSFLAEVRRRIALDKTATFVEQFPGITGCIAKYRMTDQMSCYVMVNGTAVFFEIGESIPVEDVDYFSIPTLPAVRRRTPEGSVQTRTATRRRAQRRRSARLPTR